MNSVLAVDALADGVFVGLSLAAVRTYRAGRHALRDARGPEDPATTRPER
ncbi:hypothetical protein [Streptomyces sp. NPDC055109]